MMAVSYFQLVDVFITLNRFVWGRLCFADLLGVDLEVTQDPT